MNRSFRDLERGHMGSLRSKDNKDEDLALFREMRKLEKERNDLLLLQDTDEFDDTLGMKTGNSPIFNINSGASATIRKTGADDFLNSDNDKNDYEWLLTPPGTPLFPALEMESQKTAMSQREKQKARPAARALKSRLANPQPEPTAARSSLSRQPSMSPALNTSTGGLRRPSSSGGSGSRPATPTGRSTATSTSRSTLTASSNRPASASATRPTPNTASKVASKATPSTAAKPSRSATPTSHPTLSSMKPAARARSATPTSRSTVRPSTPTSKPSAPASFKSTSRASTPTRRPTMSNGTSTPSVSSRSPASSGSKPITATVKSAGSRPSSPSPSMRPKPWKPSEMPGFSLDTPPNLRTTLPDRPPSATRGRPGAPSSRSSSVEPAPNGRVRRQSCSPARGRPPNGIIRNSGSSVPVPAVKRLQAKANDNVSPVVIGTKMVERVINMRKLAPPKQDDKCSPHTNLSGKSPSPDSSGFGRTLSKKSLDMAIRHMDIRRSIPGNLRPLMTNIPASSMYSVRSGATKKTISMSDSPQGTSSNASSDVSVNNNNISVDGPELDDEASSDKGIQSPATLHGR